MWCFSLLFLQEKCRAASRQTSNPHPVRCIRTTDEFLLLVSRPTLVTFHKLADSHFQHSSPELVRVHVIFMEMTNFCEVFAVLSLFPWHSPCWIKMISALQSEYIRDRLWIYLSLGVWATRWQYFIIYRIINCLYFELLFNKTCLNDNLILVSVYLRKYLKALLFKKWLFVHLYIIFILFIVYFQKNPQK